MAWKRRLIYYKELFHLLKELGVKVRYEKGELRFEELKSPYEPTVYERQLNKFAYYHGMTQGEAGVFIYEKAREMKAQLRRAERVRARQARRTRRPQEKGQAKGQTEAETGREAQQQANA